jgi:phospholipid-transporting ATPase
MIPSISTSGGHPVIYLPLSVIITISAIKDLFEDFKRRTDDSKENNSRTYKLTQNGFTPCKWRDIKVGDIIKVHDGDFIPADMILIKTNENSGTT